MPNDPLVSVVIPVHNAARYLAEAIHSIERQNYANIEIIAIDDGSTDGSFDVAQSFPSVRCIRQDNCGIAATRNAGVLQAKGDLLAFLDADDLWTDDKLRQQMVVLFEKPGIHLVAGRVEQFYDACRGPAPDNSPPLANDAYTAGALLIRTADFHLVGLFDTTLKVGEFVDWHSRALNLGLTEHRLESIVLRRRIHDGNTTLRQQAARGDYLSVIKAHLDRKRLAGNAKQAR
jgi:glycosyltransferase involved in cell wall biosynthesis